MGILTYHRVEAPPFHAPDPFVYNAAKKLDTHLMLGKPCDLNVTPFGDAAVQESLEPNICRYCAAGRLAAAGASNASTADRPSACRITREQ